MRLVCPHCQYSKEVPADKLPARPTRVTCPGCHASFSFAVPQVQAPASPLISCPVCHLQQPQAAACSSCGLIFAKYHPPRAAAERHPAPASGTAAENRPKAGFWLRLVALMIDGFLVFFLQVVFSLLLMFLSGNGFQLQGVMAVLVELLSLILSLFYWIFFTGYCGQTPGKMLLRIKVIRSDGEPLTYGLAFYREVIGKFISGIILGIGYLMAAFDEQKQGLHDRMAKTYVIKR
jgi:predicted Zn finger-like uncharacterized protein